MSKVLAVAWREFRHTVVRPIFVLAVLGIPVLMIGIGAIAVVIMATHEEPPLVGAVAIVAPSDEVAEAARVEFSEEEIEQERRRRQIEQAERALEGGATGGGMMTPDAAAAFQRGEVRIEIRAETGADAQRVEELKQQVQRGDLLAVAVVPTGVLEIPRIGNDSDAGATTSDEETRAPGSQRAEASDAASIRLFAAESVDSDNVKLIEQRLGASVVRVRAKRAGFPPEQAIAMLRRPGAETTRIGEGGEEIEETVGAEIRRELLPMAFLLLIWIGTLTSAQHLMMSTIEEKSNRVMEVLLSAVSPFQLMTGKIIGYGAVGLVIVVIYASLGIAATIVLATFTDFLSWVDLALLAVFYLMAYFMIASLMAAVGSAVTDIREANTLVTPVMMILMVPLFLWMPISQAPNGAIATACSFIPPATPFAMILRHAAEEPVPLWQYPATIAWGAVCTLAMIWFAAKIFRVGVLMYGKPPSPVELIKWVRYS